MISCSTVMRTTKLPEAAWRPVFSHHCPPFLPATFISEKSCSFSFHLFHYLKETFEYYTTVYHIENTVTRELIDAHFELVSFWLTLSLNRHETSVTLRNPEERRRRYRKLYKTRMRRCHWSIRGDSTYVIMTERNLSHLSHSLPQLRVFSI